LKHFNIDAGIPAFGVFKNHLPAVVIY
jgi:hypothetical protein